MVPAAPGRPEKAADERETRSTEKTDTLQPPADFRAVGPTGRPRFCRAVVPFLASAGTATEDGCERSSPPATPPRRPRRNARTMSFGSTLRPSSPLQPWRCPFTRMTRKGLNQVTRRREAGLAEPSTPFFGFLNQVTRRGEAGLAPAGESLSATYRPEAGELELESGGAAVSPKGGVVREVMNDATTAWQLSRPHRPE